MINIRTKNTKLTVKESIEVETVADTETKKTLARQDGSRL